MSPDGMRDLLGAAFTEGQPELFPSLGEADSTMSIPAIGAVVRIRDERTVLYCTRSECVAMRLAPYESWDVFRPEFDRLWQACRTLWDDQRPKTIGLRYTNEFSIGTDDGEVSEWFTLYPLTTDPLTKLLGPGIRAKLANVVYVDGSFTTDVAVSDGTNRGTREVILDVDVSLNVPRQGNFEIGESLEAMHSKINAAFEASITDRTRSSIL